MAACPSAAQRFLDGGLAFHPGHGVEGQRGPEQALALGVDVGDSLAAMVPEGAAWRSKGSEFKCEMQAEQEAGMGTKGAGSGQREWDAEWVTRGPLKETEPFCMRSRWWNSGCKERTIQGERAAEGRGSG